MKLVRLAAENFKSFEVLDLDLDGTGMFSITGPNGAGKSSIFAAVEWALYGGKRGPGAEPVMRQGAAGQCRVQLDFEVAGRLLRVVRVDHGTASLTDLGTGEELTNGRTATSRDVAVALGLTQEMFGGTFYARQKEVEALTHKSLDARKAQLERLLGIEHLRQAAELASGDARDQRRLVESMAERLPDIADLRSDLERREREAQEAAPTIKRLEAEIQVLGKEHRATTERIDALTQQIKEHGLRELAVAKKTSELEQEQASLGRLLERRDAVVAAKLELFELEPVAGAADELASRERELDLQRRNHERAQALQLQERDALETLATASDALAGLGDGAGAEAAAASLRAVEQELNENGKKLRATSKDRATAERGQQEAKEHLRIAIEAETLRKRVDELAVSAGELAEWRSRWEGVQNRNATLEAELAHDKKHRDALAGVDESEDGRCPTCHQPLVVGLGELMAEFEAQIADLESALDEVARELKSAASEAKERQVAAGELAGVQAQLKALGNPGDPGKLLEDVERATGVVGKAIAEERRLEEVETELEERLPALREAVEEEADRERRRSEIKEQLIKAEQQVATYAEQRSALNVDGYDREAHNALKAKLDQALDASKKCARLGELSETAPLLEKQIAGQEPRVAELEKELEKLRSQAEAISPKEDEPETLGALRDRLGDDIEAKRQALADEKHKVSLESETASAARARLKSAETQHDQFASERGELELRDAVARALDEYREHASRQARPMLVEEASKFLKRITNSTYPAVRLTDRYHLEIVDGDQFHPSRRFSGGEQDLAALCLRLALARTLAHQRGVEHSFVVLDEVFGSQDVDRRQMLLEQLRELADAEFQQIFVISHTDDVVDQCSLHIQVSREDGVSRAVGPIA